MSLSLSRLWQRHRSVAYQFLRYLLSGGTAAACELTTNWAMLHLGVYYMTSTIVSGLVGIVVAFLMQKYVAFRKRGSMTKHTVRYVILTAWNLFAQAMIVFLLVEYAGTGPQVAKILGIGATVSWNFFLYKFLVYV
jgi:putative flippase GtrA